MILSSDRAPARRRQVREWSFRSAKAYQSPFADVEVDCDFIAPDGSRMRAPAFYDGDELWRVRFSPHAPGDWRAALRSRPVDPDLCAEFSFSVDDSSHPGFLKTAPGQGWGFVRESGAAVRPFGDTAYDLFGMAFCGKDIRPFLERRKSQGFNLFRVRASVSRFHPPAGDFEWQTRRTSPWGGSETSPRFDLFNLDWFRSVDQSMRLFEELGLGVEFIMEGWGFEFPFNHRLVFTPEWELLWLRYLIARYDAFSSVWFWTPLNEYEYYPNGDWHWKPAADRWAMRIGRWIKDVACHGHIVSMHNGPTLPPFAERFRADPQSVDAIQFQEWGTRDSENGWLAAGIEESIRRSLKDWRGAAIFAEWGYERNPALPLKLPSHEFCGRAHTRRSAWRGAMSGLGIVAGFENSWGPWMRLEEDQPGLHDLVVLDQFLNGRLGGAPLVPQHELIQGQFELGHRPLAARLVDNRGVAVYFPAGGSAQIQLPGDSIWFDPRTGETCPAECDMRRYCCPDRIDEGGHPGDFVLLSVRT